MTFEPHPPPRLAQLDPPTPNARRAGGGWNQGHPMPGRLKQDGGAAIVLLSAVMLFLLGMAAFAVDLGWLWLNASRIQSAADAAALSGVTHLPADTAGAQTSAENASRVNGWPVGGTTTLTSSVGAENTLDVELTAQVDTYFLRLFGQPQVTIRREATAQFILPVPLGSPFNSFGDGNDLSQNFWASIGGRHVSREHGDPFMTECIRSDTDEMLDGLGAILNPNDADDDCDSGASDNPTHRNDGYFIGIEVPAGASNLSIQIWDAGYYERLDSSVETGERRITDSVTGPTETRYRVYRADDTPYDLTDNQPQPGCPEQTFDSYEMDRSTAPPTHPTTPAWANSWTTICTVGTTTPGIYVLQVRTAGDGGNNNNFSVKATTSGPQPKVYGIDSIGVFANLVGVTDLYLAEIEPVHAGKTLKVSFFDPGDAGGTAYLRIQEPGGTTASNCSWETESGSHTGSSCNIEITSGGVGFAAHGEWIVAEVRIPDDYTCDPSTVTGCWWTVEHDYSAGNAHDRMTWQIEVIGNPVRLIVDAP